MGPLLKQIPKNVEEFGGTCQKQAYIDCGKWTVKDNSPDGSGEDKSCREKCQSWRILAAVTKVVVEIWRGKVILMRSLTEKRLSLI